MCGRVTFCVNENPLPQHTHPFSLPHYNHNPLKPQTTKKKRKKKNNHGLLRQKKQVIDTLAQGQMPSTPIRASSSLSLLWENLRANTSLHLHRVSFSPLTVRLKKAARPLVKYKHLQRPFLTYYICIYALLYLCMSILRSSFSFTILYIYDPDISGTNQATAFCFVFFLLVFFSLFF